MFLHKIGGNIYVGFVCKISQRMRQIRTIYVVNIINQSINTFAVIIGKMSLVAPPESYNLGKLRMWMNTVCVTRRQ